MTDETPEGQLTIRCRPAKDDMIDLEIEQAPSTKLQTSIKPETALGLAATLLAAARVTGDQAGTAAQPKAGDRLGRTVGVDPTAIGLSQTPDGSSAALVLQFGSGILGVRLTPQQAGDLSNALGMLKQDGSA